MAPTPLDGPTSRLRLFNRFAHPVIFAIKCICISPEVCKFYDSIKRKINHEVRGIISAELTQALWKIGKQVDRNKIFDLY